MLLQANPHLSIPVADFKKVLTLIDCSLADIKWNTAANALYNLKEIGIPSLLEFLKEITNRDAQNAAVTVLYNLADDQVRVRVIAKALGIQIVAKALSEALMRVQVTLVNLVSRMSEMDTSLQDDFGRVNTARPRVIILGAGVDLEEFKEANSQKNVNSLDSIVQINEAMTEKYIRGSSGSSTTSSLVPSKHGSNRKEKEMAAESPMVKLRLKISCATTLWELARGSLQNIRKITETKASLVLAKIIEKETKELQINCLMPVMELAAVAECNPDLKRIAFKPNSPAPKAILD
ncbi:hypothetical protein BUALT_Bualt12G0068800 [Buddleja alternifolia]|uniref:Armadillo repeat-containing protein 1 n=1 Tax=Buddleja alternifolia TaxID=168488 RepID=A0AAV6WPN2_9LAMI|nr:hypothetical protein BUALT_Bualt12G0068800 [Buddleja alternifolia]